MTGALMDRGARQRARLAAAAFTILTTIAGTCGAVTAASQDEQARAALAARDFVQVQKIYGANALGDEALSAMAHYRLAIAAINLGQPVSATAHLERAMQLAPRADFASTPERLKFLRQQIAAACEKSDCTPAGATPSPMTALASAQAVAGTTTAAAFESPPAATALPVQPSTAGSATTSTAAATGPQTGVSHLVQPERTDQAWSLNHRDLLGAFAMGLLLFALWRNRGFLSQRFASMHAAASPDAPLQGHMERVRDDLASLLARVAQNDGGDKLLLIEGHRFLALIERECGRARYRVTRDASALQGSDAQAAATVASLSDKPMSALSATSDDVAALFRRPVF